MNHILIHTKRLSLSLHSDFYPYTQIENIYKNQTKKTKKSCDIKKKNQITNKRAYYRITDNDHANNRTAKRRKLDNNTFDGNKNKKITNKKINNKIYHRNIDTKTLLEPEFNTYIGSKNKHRGEKRDRKSFKNINNKYDLNHHREFSVCHLKNGLNNNYRTKSIKNKHKIRTNASSNNMITEYFNLISTKDKKDIIDLTVTTSKDNVNQINNKTTITDKNKIRNRNINTNSYDKHNQKYAKQKPASLILNAINQTRINRQYETLVVHNQNDDIDSDSSLASSICSKLSVESLDESSSEYCPSDEVSDDDDDFDEYVSKYKTSRNKTKTMAVYTDCNIDTKIKNKRHNEKKKVNKKGRKKTNRKKEEEKKSNTKSKRKGKQKNKITTTNKKKVNKSLNGKSTKKRKTKIKQRFCPECGKDCGTDYVKYNNHMRIHRSYKCDYPGCNKVFQRSDTRQDHYDHIHTKERNFACKWCGEKFFRSSRNYHQRVCEKNPKNIK